MTETIDAYVKFWNTEAGDPQRRVGAEVFAPEVSYVAPTGVRVGVDALVEFTETFVAGVGAYEFCARAEPEVHHGRARLAWELRVGGASFAEGTDVLVTDADGRITAITTFVDRAPEGAAAADGGAA